jgi:hypothetical protein
MAIRQDNSASLNISIDNLNDKTSLRAFILNQWILENSKYRYFVEVLSNGNRIYLERPGRLNKDNLPNFGEPYELILKTLRWLFIEQDVTYWSGQGRNMLYNGILNL